MSIRVLVDCHAFDDDFRQGITTYISGLYGAAVKQAEKIDFYFASRSPEKLEPLFGQGENVHYFKLCARGRFRRLIGEFPQLIKKANIDYAHFQYISPLVKSCREIVTLHDILFCDFPQYFSLKYRLSKGFWFRRSAKRADILLTVSNYSKIKISELWKIPEARIIVTPNAVASDWYEVKKSIGPCCLGLPFDHYVLYVGRLEPRKNHALMVKCFRELRLWERNIGIVFAGHQAARCVQLQNELNRLPQEAEKFVRFWEGVDDKMLKQLYLNASLFVFPSLAEGFGIPPLEAGVLEVPCLCSDSTAMNDFDFFGAGRFSPYEPEQLKGKLFAFFNGDLRLPSARSIRETIKQRYSWSYSSEVLLSAVCKDYHSGLS